MTLYQKYYLFDFIWCFDGTLWLTGACRTTGKTLPRVELQIYQHRNAGWSKGKNVARPAVVIYSSPPCLKLAVQWLASGCAFPPMLPTLQISPEFELVFCGFAIFWRLSGCLFLGLLQLKFTCFMGLLFHRFPFWWVAFFSNIMALLLLKFNAKWNLGCICVTLLILGLICGFVCLFLHLIHLMFFVLFEFSYQRILRLFLRPFTYLGLFFKFSCLFLQNNLASLYAFVWGQPYGHSLCLRLQFACFLWNSCFSFS